MKNKYSLPLKALIVMTMASIIVRNIVVHARIGGGRAISSEQDSSTSSATIATTTAATVEDTAPTMDPIPR